VFQVAVPSLPACSQPGAPAELTLTHTAAPFAAPLPRKTSPTASAIAWPTRGLGEPVCCYVGDGTRLRSDERPEAVATADVIPSRFLTLVLSWADHARHLPP
jgi:hypothetical protein